MLYGRSSELAVIQRRLAQARQGHGSALVIAGEAGIGKTALLQAVREHAEADGFAVVGATGIQAEANLPFAALSEVLRPLLSGLPKLPAPRAGALATALALADGPRASGGRFAACAGCLALLEVATEQRPLLVLLDDAHWLDSASAECLGYAARRLGDSRVALLAAVRPEQDLPPALGGPLETMTLGGLETHDALALLDAHAPALARSVARSVVELAAGNPFVLVEVPRLLDDRQRDGLAPLDRVPLPYSALRAAVERRLSVLEEEARAAATVAAASVDGALDAVVGACRELRVAPDALERAETVLTLTEDRVRFAHPLLRALVYEQASAGERRRAHAALARHADPDAAAWHLAAAALGPDDAAADALEAAGFRAIARGAHSAATDALARSAHLTADRRTRGARFMTAGLQAALGGDYVRATALLEPAAEGEDGPTVEHLLALIALNGGTRSASANHARLTTQAERVAATEPAMAASMHADAAVIAVVAGDCALALGSAQRAAATLPVHAPGTIRCQVRAGLGMMLALRGRVQEGRRELEAAAALLDDVPPLTPAAQSISFTLHAQLCAGQPERLREQLAALAAPARAAGTVGLLPYFLLVGADAAFRVGEWDACGREAAEAVAIADECGQLGPLSIALVISGRIRAARGDTAGGRAELERALAVADGPGYGATTIWARAALGLTALGLGETEPAIAELEEAQRLSRQAALEDPVIVPWASDLVEAYVRSGRIEDAAQVTRSLEDSAERGRVPLGLALAARCRGLIARDGFDECFERALALHHRSSAPFEHARTMLAWGARLHRARRRSEARSRLRSAAALFEHLGAAPWVEQSTTELRAAGARQRRAREHGTGLTSQELRVAEAAASGKKTREIAADLFLSPKTVEYHLGQVYRKLGVHSRAALATVLAERDRPTSVPGP